ncbi:TetR/AcrR family transcriptional regulator [Candidatus Mycobacterium methanotrophicum]|uniref:TetR/AcrR family transcriptional regulator n=1 Tax=Candidatus Mycobacterium methanotrophicum TaxID=2943498 RepID=A0ABY4QMC4_9MYCO|nr:TetR/AcrR family transcriptional regulator [Candidatus Mycobacterium methanotrophicum]UQX12162.1 TetR/AcrR family transcriptional regulator [Candidatus Mycobacterium methanotrophicum]
MTSPTSAQPDKRADTTRQQLLNAAAHQFARRAYHNVGLDDILGEAELTKGAMYFHFRSKHALALAVIEDQNAQARELAAELAARKLSGLETLIDFSYQLAIQDITEDTVRAGFTLLESIGRLDGLRMDLLGAWIQTGAGTVERAIAEGDIFDACNPHDVGQLLVSIYLGLRQTSSLDEPEQFLSDFEKAWALVLPGIVRPERIDYFRQFIGRRTAIAVGSTSALAGSR